jgi:hypothetical protein
MIDLWLECERNQLWFLEYLRKITKNVPQDSWYPGRNLGPVPPNNKQNWQPSSRDVLWCLITKTAICCTSYIIIYLNEVCKVAKNMHEQYRCVHTEKTSPQVWCYAYCNKFVCGKLYVLFCARRPITQPYPLKREMILLCENLKGWSAYHRTVPCSRKRVASTVVSDTNCLALCAKWLGSNPLCLSGSWVRAACLLWCRVTPLVAPRTAKQLCAVGVIPPWTAE